MRCFLTFLGTAGLAMAVALSANRLGRFSRTWAAPPGQQTARPALPIQPSSPAAGAVEDADISPEEAANIRVYRTANRSVVNITTRSLPEATGDLFDLFLSTGPREGSGSGSILDKQGHILTNFHVIEDARQITVTLFDSTTYPARLVGVDPNNDVAVLKIQAPVDKLNPLGWGDSNRLVVGMRVFAIGNPFGLERTLTTGIVSSLNRSLRSENNRLIRGVIQTDAAINPGNSGGPLLNRRAEIVGITTAIVGRASQSSGVGLAIPSNTAHRIVDELIRHGHVIRPECGILSVFETDRGLLINQLARGGAAQRAGLQGPQIVRFQRNGFEYRAIDRSRADLIVAVDDHPVKSLDDLLSYIESKKVGDTVMLTIVRNDKQMQVEVELKQSRD
jgi:S1-C subfamily serine protease